MSTWFFLKPSKNSDFFTFSPAFLFKCQTHSRWVASGKTYFIASFISLITVFGYLSSMHSKKTPQQSLIRLRILMQHQNNCMTVVVTPWKYNQWVVVFVLLVSCVKCNHITKTKIVRFSAPTIPKKRLHLSITADNIFSIYHGISIWLYIQIILKKRQHHHL